jgi:hypothetical protein
VRKGRTPLKRGAKKASPDAERRSPDEDAPSAPPRDNGSPPGPPDESEKALA